MDKQQNEKVYVIINKKGGTMKSTKYLIKCGKLFDGITEEWKSNMEILVENNIIIEVGEKVTKSEDAIIIDRSDLTITPGLIDNHMHIDYPKGLTLAELPLVSNNAALIHTVENLRETLDRGFTGIRGMNAIGQNRSIFEVKNQQNKGYLKGTSRLYPARVMGSEGSHADASGELHSSENIAEAFKSDAIGTGKEFFIKAVRDDLKYGASFIKIMYSGGFFTQLDGPEDCQLTDEEVKALIDTTHLMNRTITAHCYGDNLIEKLVEFNIDGIEHAALITPETAKKVEEKDIYVVPTFQCYEPIIRKDEAILNTLSPAMREKFEKYSDQLKKSRQVILNSNIRLGYGSDIVGTKPVYESWREFQSWINSGATALRTLKAATFENAKILGIEDRLGTIEVGKIADIVGFAGELENNPEGVKDCRFVMKDGEVFKDVK